MKKLKLLAFGMVLSLTGAVYAFSGAAVSDSCPMKDSDCCKKAQRDCCKGKTRADSCPLCKAKK